MSTEGLNIFGPNRSVAEARITNRLALRYVLDVIAIARGDRHLLDNLLITTITQANVSTISRRADLQVTYAGEAEAPPDDMRRPVSINAVATSLGLPFETTRRRIKGLARQGLCRIVDGGVIVPTEILTSAEYLQNAYKAYERLRAFYYELRDLDLLAPLPRPTVALTGQQVPIRPTARLAADYVLRNIDTILEAVGDLVEGIVLLEIFRANVENLPNEQRGRDGVEPTDFVPDNLRTPVRINALAKRVGLPGETTRRHVMNLVEAGFVQRSPSGFIVPSGALARGRLVIFMSENLTNLHRMFSGLAQLGVLDVWDQLNPRTSEVRRIPQNG